MTKTTLTTAQVNVKANLNAMTNRAKKDANHKLGMGVLLVENDIVNARDILEYTGVVVGKSLEACADYGVVRDMIKEVINPLLAFVMRPRSELTIEATMADVIELGKRLKTAPVSRDGKQCKKPLALVKVLANIKARHNDEHLAYHLDASKGVDLQAMADAKQHEINMCELAAYGMQRAINVAMGKSNDAIDELLKTVVAPEITPPKKGADAKGKNLDTSGDANRQAEILKAKKLATAIAKRVEFDASEAINRLLPLHITKSSNKLKGEIGTLVLAILKEQADSNKLSNSHDSH